MSQSQQIQEKLQQLKDKAPEGKVKKAVADKIKEVNKPITK